jgi:hypothetical protein
MLLNADSGANLAASWTVLLRTRRGWFGGFVHAAWSDVRWPLQALQPRDLFALLADNLLQRRNLTKQPDRQRFKLSAA